MTDLQEITDALGRKIKVRVLDPEQYLDLIEAAGEQASNQMWIRYAMVVASAAWIDEKPYPVPTTKAMVKLIARELKNEGVAAISVAAFGKVEEDGSELVAVAKN